MKRQSLILALSFTLAAASGAFAADKTTDSKEKKAVKTGETEKVADSSATKTVKKPTGSYIPRTIRRQGEITDGVNQLIVLDRAAIERTGASDLKQVLIRRGVR